MKSILIAFIFTSTSLFSVSSFARPKMNLSEEQRACMKNILGERGEQRPSREKHQSAMSSCGIEDQSSSDGQKEGRGGKRGSRE